MQQLTLIITWLFSDDEERQPPRRSRNDNGEAGTKAEPIVGHTNYTHGFDPEDEGVE